MIPPLLPPTVVEKEGKELIKDLRRHWQ